MSAFVAQALREAELRRPAVNEPSPPLAPEVTVDQLAAAAAEGDVEAVGRLYDVLVEPIYRYVIVRVRRREDAEDLTQLVFERIVASLPRYRPRGRPFEAWAFRIARNAVIDHVRRERNHEPLDDEGHLARGDVGPEALSLRWRGDPRAARCHRLPDRGPAGGARPALRRRPLRRGGRTGHGAPAGDGARPDIPGDQQPAATAADKRRS